MNCYFRRIELKDIESVWSLIEVLKAEKADMSLTDLTCKEQVRSLVDNPAELTYVAVTKEESRVLSVVKGRRDLSEEKFHSVFLSAATHPDARGLGFAAKLTNYALSKMKSEGVNIARIYVYSNNLASLNTVKKLGFAAAGMILRHHRDLVTGDYVNDLIFHKILDD